MKNSIIILSMCVLLLSCGNQSGNQQKAVASNLNATETVSWIKAKSAWLQEGKEVYALVVADNKQDTVATPVKCKVVKVKADRVQLRCSETTYLDIAKIGLELKKHGCGGCSGGGCGKEAEEKEGCDDKKYASIGVGKTWWETTPDIFATSQAAIAYVQQKNWTDGSVDN